MLFNSYQFVFLYLPITLAGCFWIARRFGATPAQDWLALASLVFYGAWNLQFLPLLLGSIVFNYAVARAMLRRPEDRRSTLLTLAVIVDLGLLGYYKYAGFFVDVAGHATGTGWAIEAILLPLGISFYTFQQITLLVDVSNGDIERFRFRDFLLFVTFFPHLIAGPIVHHREMMPQFERATYRFDADDFAVGVTLFAAGLFKKTVLADGIAAHVGPLYAAANDGTPATLAYAWAATIGFLLQMYFDFSGYSEMALGLGRMVGIRLPVNFNSPLKARNVVEYWGRWHMTLTRFLTAYIYNPIAVRLARRRALAGQRGVAGKKTTTGAFLLLIALPTVVTMFLSGLWHGAGMQFLVFGLLHGFFLVVCHGWRLYRPLILADTPTLRRVMGPLGLVVTFLCTAVALTYFKADSVAAGNRIVAGLVGLNGIVLPEVISVRLPGLARALGGLGVRFEPANLVELLKTYAWMALLLPIALIPPNILQVMREKQPALGGPGAPEGAAAARILWRPTTLWAVLTALALVTSLLTLGQVTEFLYWQF